MAAAKKGSLSGLTDAELDSRAEKLMADRADMEASFKADLRDVREERDRRVVAARVADMTDSERAALREALGED